MKKKLPTLKSDEEAEAFVETADLSTYDLSGSTPVRFEFAKKDKSVTLRMPASLLGAIKERADQENMPYQRYMRRVLENALSTENRPTSIAKQSRR